MFNFIHFLFVVLVVASSASGLIIPRHRSVQLSARTVTQPPTYAAGYLEPYETYHLRYLAINCENKHNTTFFDKCCHPLLATENLKDNRPAECTPTAAEMSSANAALPTSTVKPNDGSDDGCDDGPSSSTHKAKSTSAPENVGPEPPKSTPKPTPKATPKKESTTSTHSSSKSKPSSKSSSSGLLSGQIFTDGVATFYLQNGVAGACGDKHSDNDLIAAINQAQYGDSSQKSSLCGKKVKIVNTKNHKSVVVTIADDCPTCKKDSIDLSKGAFTQIATEAEGEVDISWSFL